MDDFKRVEGKVTTFFAKQSIQVITNEMIGDLYMTAKKEKRNARICLHANPEANFHDMIILQWKESYQPTDRSYPGFPPHRHLQKAESIQGLEHSQRVYIFNEKGKILSKHNIGEGEIIHIGAGEWHLTIPMDDYVIYRETKCGPFLGEMDREFALWAKGLTMFQMIERLGL